VVTAPRRLTELVPWAFWRRDAPRFGHGLLTELDAQGATPVPGLFAAGGLARGEHGVDAAVADGARAGAEIATRLAASPAAAGEALDLAVAGAGPAGCAAALEAARRGVSRLLLIEAEEPFHSIALAPADRPVAGVPTLPGRVLRATRLERDALLAELRVQLESAGIALRTARVQRAERETTGGALSLVLSDGCRIAARAMLLATGRFGCPRHLGVPGEDLAHVHATLDVPADFAARRALVVGGGERAARTALRLAEAGAEVTLVHRGAMLVRPDHRTLARLSERLAGAPLEPWRKRRRGEVPRRAPGPGTIALRLVSQVLEIGPGVARIQEGVGPAQEIPADDLFVRIGFHPPALLARVSGLTVREDRAERG
jgi:thioredoxin reductase